MRKYSLILLLAVILILSTTNTTSESENPYEEYLVESPHQIFFESYTSHGPIQIDNDTDFDDTAIAEGWEGFGNSTHPYIIEGYNITSDEIGIYIALTTRHFIIRNCYLTQANIAPAGPGLNFYETPNAQVVNVTVFDKSVGLYAAFTDNLVVNDLEVDSCQAGVVMEYSNNVKFTELELSNCLSIGIDLYTSNFVTIDRTSCSGPGINGIRTWDCDDFTLSNINVNDFTAEGIYIESSDNCIIENATVYTCGDNLHAGFNVTNSNYFTATNITTWDIAQGFWIKDCYQPIIQDSYIHDGYQTGINVVGAYNLIIRRTQVESNMYYGIGLHSVTNGLIENVECTYNNWNALYIEYSPDCTIQYCEFANSGFQIMKSEVYAIYSNNLLIYNTSISYNHNFNGLEIDFCDYTDITRCIINNNPEHGVLISNSIQCSLDNNTMYLNGQDGIHISSCEDVLLNNQNTHHNSMYGVSLDGSNTVTITDSKITFNGDDGIAIDSSSHCIVTYCAVYNNSFFGINPYLSDNLTISFCDIYWNFYDGIYLQYSDDIVISNNEFWENGGGDCEITVDNSDNVDIIGNTLIGNRVTQGIYATWSYYLNITGNTISGNFDDGLNIQNCLFTTIASNTISDNGGVGLYLLLCDFSTINDNTITGNGGYGVFVAMCVNCSFSDNTVSGNQNGGAMFGSSYNLTIEHNSFLNNVWDGILCGETEVINILDNTITANGGRGIYIDACYNCAITRNNISENRFQGIYVIGGIDFIFEYNNIFNNGWIDESNPSSGVYISWSTDCQFLHNNVYNNTKHGLETVHVSNCVVMYNTIHGNLGIISLDCGIYLSYSDGAIIENNTIFENVNDGIYVFLSHNCEIRGNLIFNNAKDGIFLQSCNGTLIIGNIIFSNDQYGIHIAFTNTTRIYNNDIGLNSIRDAVERNSTGANFWDDGISLGNYWWGISRTLDNYTIFDEGITETNQDNYPLCSMWIDDATALNFEISSTGNSVTFNAFGYNPNYYRIFLNGELLQADGWDGTNITISLDGLQAGTNSILVRIYHITGAELNATVVATVDDTTPPTWVSVPVDQTINFGEALSYQLSATDYSPLGTWSVNNTLFSIIDGLLTNASVLEPGDYRLRITVEDIYGNELSIDIWVHVIGGPTTSDTGGGGLPPESMLLLVLGAGGAVVIIIIIGVVMKKKST